MGLNPLIEILFAEMTLKAWKNYSIKQVELMEACELEGKEYVEPDTEGNEDDFIYYYEEDGEEEEDKKDRGGSSYIFNKDCL